MKNRYILATILVILMPYMANAQNIPIPDNRNATIFQGNVFINGASAQDGTNITAMSGNVLRGYVDKGSIGGQYKLAVLFPGAGDTITIFVNGVSAATYTSTTNDVSNTVSLDLSVRTVASYSGGGGGSSGTTPIQTPKKNVTNATNITNVTQTEVIPVDTVVKATITPVNTPEETPTVVPTIIPVATKKSPLGIGIVAIIGILFTIYILKKVKK